ncbi:MAG: hypothetical protein MUC85_01915 [Anaerolineales bacterium]|jgi:hypothetical protein|nr:hypothetical protein [Anaerolineales bacterium]
MLPEPKRVAGVLKDIFKSNAERRQEAEDARNEQLHTGKTQLRRHINRQQQMVTRLTALARRALELNDEARFRQVGRQILSTRQDIQRWEQYLLSLELLEARRDQARASVDLLQSVKAMSESLKNLTAPEKLGELQRELDQGLARAISLEERMAVMMDAIDSTMDSDLQVDERALQELRSGLTEEVAVQERSQYDREIEAGLEKVRAEMSKK